MFLKVPKLLTRFDTCWWHPYSASIEITTSCNLKCTMCNRNQLKPKSASMKPEDYEHILRATKIRKASLVGLGETLISPYLIDILEISKQYGVRVDITTNGTLLTPRMVDALKQYPIDHITISIDHPDPSEYRKIRVGADLERVIENIRYLTENTNIRTIIQCIMTKENLSSAIEMADLARRLSVNKLAFLHLFSLSKEQDRIHAHWSKDYPFVVDALKRISRANGQKILTHPPMPAPHPCLEPWFKPTILIDGTVLACCWMSRFPRGKFTEWYMGKPVRMTAENFVMGNIFTQKFSKIWNSPQYKKVRSMVRDFKNNGAVSINQFNAMRGNTNNYCQTCLFRWSCAC